MNGLALICTFFVMGIYHNAAMKPIPRWARAIFLCPCARGEVTLERQVLHTSVQKPEKKEDAKMDSDGTVPNGKDQQINITEESVPLESECNEEKTKDGWIMLAKHFDRIAFGMFAFMYLLLVIVFFTYIWHCKAGGSLCLHPVKNIFEEAEKF